MTNLINKKDKYHFKLLSQRGYAHERFIKDIYASVEDAQNEAERWIMSLTDVELEKISKVVLTSKEFHTITVMFK